LDKLAEKNLYKNVLSDLKTKYYVDNNRFI